MSISGINLENFNGIHHQIIDLTKYSNVWGYPRKCHHNVILSTKTLKHQDGREIDDVFNYFNRFCNYNRITRNPDKAEGLLKRIQELEIKSKIRKLNQQSKNKQIKNEPEIQIPILSIKDKVHEIESFNNQIQIKLTPYMNESEINHAYDLMKASNQILEKLNEIDSTLKPDYEKSLLSIIIEQLKQIKLYNDSLN